MSKRHVIINVGKAGNVMSKAAPDAYSIEATGYEMDEVHELFESVHALVRPTDDGQPEPAERIGGPIPFKLSGFSLVRKLADDSSEQPTAKRYAADTDIGPEFLARMFSGLPTRFPPDPNADAHSVADELDRCDCGTDTPSPGRIAVRLNGVNHRFPSYDHARDFVELYGLNHTAVFILKATDPSLCCFPYTFQHSGSGEFMAFENREMAEEIAATYGVHDPEEITYHEDEHRPEHRVDEEAYRARTKRAQSRAAGVKCPDDCACRRMSLAAANGPGKCSDTACGCHAVAEALKRDVAAANERDAQAAEESEQAEADLEREEQRAADRADATLYATGAIVGFAADERVSGKIPGQRDGDKPVESKPRLPQRKRTISEHPDPCLPGCTCGNGPAPLAGDDPTDA